MRVGIHAGSNKPEPIAEQCRQAEHLGKNGSMSDAVAYLKKIING